MLITVIIRIRTGNDDAGRRRRHHVAHGTFSQDRSDNVQTGTDREKVKGSRRIYNDARPIMTGACSPALSKQVRKLEKNTTARNLTSVRNRPRSAGKKRTGLGEELTESVVVDVRAVTCDR